MVSPMVEARPCNRCSVQNVLCRLLFLFDVVHMLTCLLVWITPRLIKKFHLAGVSLFAALGFLLYGGR